MEENVNIHLDRLDDLLCFIARAAKGSLVCLCGVCDELCCLLKSPNHDALTCKQVKKSPLQPFFHSLFPVDSHYDNSSP